MSLGVHGQISVLAGYLVGDGLPIGIGTAQITRILWGRRPKASVPPALGRSLGILFYSLTSPFCLQKASLVSLEF